jgi:cyclopropane fatty-acyl-phospholipid synthase-like methyltransferase
MRDLRLVLEGDRSKMLKYATHPTDPAVGPDDSVDLVISQSVLEHVVDLRTFLTKSYRWLKPGGYASHQFDLTSHDIVPGWDEHRSFSDDSWKLVVGRRAFMINRLPYSAIIAIFEECGFHVLRADRLRMQHTVPRARLAESWSAVSDDDLDTLGGYVIAQKPR